MIGFWHEWDDGTGHVVGESTVSFDNVTHARPTIEHLVRKERKVPRVEAVGRSKGTGLEREAGSPKLLGREARQRGGIVSATRGKPLTYE